MQKWIVIVLALFTAGCDTEKAPEVAYIKVNGLGMNTTASEGSSSSKLTTLWVKRNGEQLGAFTPPCRIPIPVNKLDNLVFTAGVNTNGFESIRNMYEMLQPITKSFSVAPYEEVVLSSPGEDNLLFEYKDNIDLHIVEDFDDVGVSFAATPKSDTTLHRTNDPSEMLSVPGESNTYSGYYVVKPIGVGEFKSLVTYELPKQGANVWVELDYKCDIPLAVGIYANRPTQSNQAPVLTLYSTEGEWKKVYINLVSEVSYYTDAIDYNLFFGSINASDSSTAHVYLDNIKLLY